MPLHDKTDSELLKDFHLRSNQAAFTLLVERHLRVVFTVAKNRVGGDTQLAEDISQIVFAELAIKARKLSLHSNLKAWLFKTSRFTASKMIRQRMRQTERENQFERLHSQQERPDSELENKTLKALIDESIGQLPFSDQEALLLRFFEALDYKAIGERLDMQANAARMKVTRALEKLETRFNQRGIATSAAALSAALSGYASGALPTHLTHVIVTASLAKAGSLTSVALLSALKLPLAATVAALAAGFAVEKQIDKKRQAPFDEPPVPASSTSQTPLVTPQADTTSPRDEIDLAYAALDRDAELLAQRLREVESEIQRLHNRRPQKGRVYNMSELDTKPTVSAFAQPDYPLAQTVTQAEGSATIEFTLGPDGKASDLRVLKASHPDFARSALESVAKSEFAPGRIAQTAVPTLLRIPILFTPEPPDGQLPTQDWF